MRLLGCIILIILGAAMAQHCKPPKYMAQPQDSALDCFKAGGALYQDGADKVCIWVNPEVLKFKESLEKAFKVPKESK